MPEETTPAPEQQPAEQPPTEQAPAEQPQTAAAPAEQPSADAKPKTAQKPASNISSNERMLGAAAYVPMLFVLTLVSMPKSKFCQMHGKQGIVVSGLTFLVLFILVLIPSIGSLLFLALIALIAIGAYQAYEGVEWKIPVLHDIAMKLNVDQLFAGTTVKPTSTTEAPTQPAAEEQPPAEAPPAEAPPKSEDQQTPNPPQAS